MPDIFQLSKQFNEELLRLERKAASAMVRAYAITWHEIQKELLTLTTKLTNARAAGAVIPSSWVYREQRLQRIQLVIESQMERYSRFASKVVTQTQLEASHMAQANSFDLMKAGLGDIPRGAPLPAFALISDEAAVSQVGFMGDGSPLKALFDQIGPDMSRRAEQVLVSGVTTGLGPKEMARRMRDELGIGLNRSLTISRTETLRVYREVSSRTYQRNNDLVSGWVWVAALDTRTCAMCWAMHGTVHTLEERLDDHPNGRCSAIPRMKSWEEMGFQGILDTRPDVPEGSTVFRKLPADQQKEILGPTKYKAYKDGELRLPDLVGRKYDPKWGSHRYELSARALKIQS